MTFRTVAHFPRRLFGCLLWIYVSHGLSLSAETLAVSTLQIQRQPGYEIERVYGGELVHRRQSTLGFESPGIIGEVLVDEGDKVLTGQKLLSLESSRLDADIRGAIAEVEAARAAFDAEKAQLALSTSTLNRNRQLSRSGHISSQVLDEIEQQHQVRLARLNVAETQLRSASARADRIHVELARATLHAPYDGIVQSRHVDEGSVINPGMPALTLVEASKMEVRIGLPVKMAGFLDASRAYYFQIDQDRYSGELKTVLPRVDVATGTVTALFTIEVNTAKTLYAGTLAELELNVAVSESGFWIPLTALAESQRGLWSVLVVDEAAGEAKVEARLVEILHRGRDAVFVRGTLNEGDLVVDTGTSRIVPGQSVHIAGRSSPVPPGIN